MIKSKFRTLRRGVCALLAVMMCFGMVSVSASAASSTAKPTTPIEQIDVPVEDGVYYADVDLWNASTNQASMGNASLRGSSSWATKHPEDTSYAGAIIVVKDNKATALVEYMPMGFLGTYGFMYELESVNAKYLQQWGGIYDGNDENSPVYTSTQTLTRHLTTEGKTVYDNYNNPSSEYVYDGSEDQAKRPAGYGYTEERTINISDVPYSHLIAVDVTPITVGDNEVPTTAADYSYKNAAYVHVFVPVMFSIMASSGDQYAKMKVDWTSLEKIENPEENVEYTLYTAKQIEQGNYTNASYQNLQTAISDVTAQLENVWPSQDLELSGSGMSAQPVLNQKDYTDEEKAEMAKTINDAVAALEELGDKTALNRTIELAQSKDESLFTEDTYKTFAQALEAAEAVQADSDAGKTAVDNTETVLSDAILALVYKDADYTAVDAAILTVPEDLSLYTDETAEAVTAAVNAVVLEKDITQQAEVDAMAQAINDAVSALVYKDADYAAVDEALAAVPEDLSLYTDETAEAVTAAVNAVVLEKDITQQAEVDAMAQAVNDAVSALVYKDADYTAVDKALAAVPEDLSVYSENAAAAVNDAVAAVVRGKNITEQAEVDAMAKAIESAVRSLTKTGFGDVNGDGMVDIQDVTTIQKFIAKICDLSDEYQAAADVDRDGSVTISDATMIQKYLAKIIDSLD